ncbi:MAG TPA: nitrilase-related carbon-nitrogen hydrolase [Acidimicrobiia bacterium]|nr:nitrilase-related carbon-nitrogen hydrolase [Acidimicrobiia bacterium]
MSVTRVAVCQLGGRTLEEAPESLDACRELVAEAASMGAQVAVLPEGAYPAYVLGSAEAARAVLADGPDPIDAFGAMAAAHAVTLVAGIVVDAPVGLLNAAVTFGPDGRVLAQTAKRFLWHFDREWFAAGDDSPVAETAVGRVGALVCADARLPEIARTLAVRGAALVCDPTAWVTSTPGSPSNIQPEFLVAARCIENGFVMACASKCGFEGPHVAYAGRSMIVGPDGSVLAEASVDREEVVVADVDLSGLPRPPVARDPSAYGDLLSAWSALRPSADRVRIAAANAAGVPVLDAADVFVSPAGVDVAGAVPRVAVIDEMLAPEPSRIAALRGAEVLAFVGDAPLAVLRARAAENRVFVVASGSVTAVIAPSGAVVADAPSDRPFACAADCLLAEAAHKEMAPGTDVFADRQPTTYWDLAR